MAGAAPDSGSASDVRRRRHRTRSIQYAAKPTAIPVDFTAVSERYWIVYVRPEDLVRRNSHNRRLKVS